MRKDLLTNGASLIAQVLQAALAKGVEVWTEAPADDLVVEDGRVVGVVTRTDLLKARYGQSYVRERRHKHQKPGETESALRLRERMPASLQRILGLIGEAAVKAGGEAFLVGGCVRDLLLGVPNSDVDVLVEPDAVALARSLAETLGEQVSLKVEARFRTAHLADWDAVGA